MQQNNIHILCTRLLPDWLVEEAVASGISVEVKSFIKTEPIQSIEVQQEIENAMLQSAIVVFTSMNAVEAVAATLEEQQPDWSIYCIGAATKKLVTEFFGEHTIVGTANDAEELADIIIEEHPSDEVIFFCGDQRRDELPEKLIDNGIEVNEIVVYETIMVPNTIDKTYNGILFFSPSAVKSFFLKNKLASETILFAIGNTTANEIKKYSSNKIIISEEPSKESLLQQAIERFTK